MAEPTIETLLGVISAREAQARAVLDSRHSDARHRVTADRYRRALSVFRGVLEDHKNDKGVLEEPEVVRVVQALGLGQPEAD